MAFEFQRMDCPPFAQPILTPGRMLTFEARQIDRTADAAIPALYAMDPAVERLAQELQD